MSTKKVSASNAFWRTKDLTLIGLMTAITCVLAPFSIPLPFSPVPISFTNLAIFLTVFVLGMKNGLISYLIYFLLGCVGLPIFSGFSGGMGKVAGPTGGYLIGFFFLTLIAGYFIDQWHGRKWMPVLGMLLGSAVCYLFGTLWLSRQLGMTFLAGLGVGVLPYLPGDIAKIFLAAIVGPVLRRATRRL
ncbi:MAG: biotin transporter BioY [Hungatella sp.]